MGNPINWGGTPLENSAIRAFIAICVTGIIAMAAQMGNGAQLQEAAIGTIAVVGPLFLWLLGFGGMDQARVGTGTVIPSDVPVQIETQVAVFGDMAPGTNTPRTAEGVAEYMTRHYQAEMRKRHDR
jgi:hypothetical protein